MNKLNLGSGHDYKKGFVNLDSNRFHKADVYADLNKKLPFKNNTFDYILASHILEHFENVDKLLKEIHRVAKPLAIIRIYGPHYSGRFALKVLDHKSYFGLGTLSGYTSLCPERFFPILFDLLEEKLFFFRPQYKIFKKINFLFNFNKKWQAICERFNPVGFDEVHYTLRVIK